MKRKGTLSRKTEQLAHLLAFNYHVNMERLRDDTKAWKKTKEDFESEHRSIGEQYPNLVGPPVYFSTAEVGKVDWIVDVDFDAA